MKENSDDDSIEEFIGEEEQKDEKSENIENDNIEINENIELEYEIKIPHFLISLSNSTINNERVFNKEILKSELIRENRLNSLYTTNNNTSFDPSFTYTIGRKESINSNNNENEDKKQLKIINEEDISLLSKENSPNISHKHLKVNFSFTDKNYIEKKNKTPTPGINIDNNILRSKSNNITNFAFKGRKKNPEIDGLEQIHLYKKLFNEEKYDELEKLIDNDLKDDNIIEIKFNFTFEKYLFGKNQCIYIIRCINNKNDNRTLSNSSEDNIMNDTQNQIKRRLEKFRKNYEILIEEKEIFNENITNLLKLAENENFKKLIKDCHKDILNLSKIHGKHHLKEIEDENSSQSSLSGYNSDLSKMSRIQEIRKNLMTKSPNSTIIFYIKLLPILWFIISIIFSVIYLFLFNKIKNEVVDAGNYSSNLFNAQIQLIQILITLIETYSLYYYKNDSSYLNTYYEGNSESEYFDIRKKEGLKMIDESVDLILYLIKESRHYFSGDTYSLWEKITVQFFVSTPFIYNESFSFIPMDVLIETKNLFMLKYFSLEFNEIINEDMELEILYSKFSAIEGGYGIVIPKIFSMNSEITYNFILFNNSRKHYFKYILVIYSLISFMMWFFYNYYLFIIILSMRDGLEKITKITQEKIDDCIKRIIIFQKFYKKKFEIYTQKKDIKSNIKTQFKLNLEKKQTQSDMFLTKKCSTFIFLNKKSDLNYNESLRPKNSFNNNSPNEYKSINNNKNVNNNINDNYNNPENIKNSMNKSYLDFSLNLSLKDFSEPKKTKKLNKFLKIFIYHSLIILFLVLFLTLIYYFAERFINDNTYLFWSRVYLIENFLYTSGSLLYMQCQLINCESTGEINRTDIINETLESVLFQTLPKFPKLSKFYYNEYLIDACAAMYGFDNDDYLICKNLTQYIQYSNNTQAIKKIILTNIELILYENEINKEKYEDYNSISLFGSNEFGNIMILYRKFYINCVNNLKNILEKSTSGKAEKENNNIIICCIIFVSIIGMNMIYIHFFFLKVLIQKFTVSRSFVMIIPSYYIMNTQDLDNWLEKADNQ